jgi:toxin CcdB
MNPSFKVRGSVLVLDPLDMVSVALDQLGDCVGSLAENGQEIADELDDLLTRSWQ